MPLFHFSEEFKAKARAAIAPLSVKVLRQVMDSPDVLIESLWCTRCGFSREFDPPRPTKATAIRDCEWTHEFMWVEGVRCGGQVAFATRAVLGSCP